MSNILFANFGIETGQASPYTSAAFLDSISYQSSNFSGQDKKIKKQSKVSYGKFGSASIQSRTEKYTAAIYPIASEKRTEIFEFLLDNFVFENGAMQSVLKYYFANHIEKRILKEYIDAADDYFDIKARLLHVTNGNQSNEKLTVSLVPRTYSAELSDSIDSYENNFLFYRRDEDPKFEILIR